MLKTQPRVRNVNSEHFKAGNNCFKLTVIGLYLMSWTQHRPTVRSFGVARRTKETTVLIVDKLFQLWEKVFNFDSSVEFILYEWQK